MNIFLRKISLMNALCAVVVISSCGDAANNTTSQSRPDTTSTTKQVAKVESEGLTLPLLDALMYEADFQQELKNKIGLTDAQVKAIKELSRTSVEELTEDGDINTASTRNISAAAKDKLVNAIGADKTDALLQLVAARYANEDVAGLLPTEPNAVPADTRIVVNAPAYRMDIFQSGKLVKTYKVGIGYPEFPLPTGMRRAEQIIFNPTWTPPDEPWVKGKVKPGEKVAAGSKLNPLGPIKIPIGLPSLIHGGKAVEKLGNFASHGCVGMTNAQVQDFAGTLAQLSGATLTADSIQQLGKDKGKTRTIALTNSIPVELRYETIVAEGGALHIYRDVYERGSNTLESAKRILATQGVKYDQLSPQEVAALEQALHTMNTSAQGNPVDTTSTKKNSSKNVTRTVKGEKEIIVPISGLGTKGYPVPVALNDGRI